MGEEGKAMDLRERIEMQLLRVSRGAHELTQMIDSWSKSPNLDGQPKQLVNGLLRGSVDVQESLLTLSRLQEATRRASTSRSRRERDGGGGGDDSIEVMRSRSFHKEYRLLRQNSFQLSSDDGRISPSKHMLMLSGGRRANSSNQTKKKVPNLVAKLMGLQELPNDHHTSEQGEEEKVLYPKRKQKTLEEIIETMRTNGVLKSNQSVKSDATRQKTGTHKNGSIPPIVIMKPQHLPYRKTEEDNASSHGCTLQKALEITGSKRFDKEKNEPAQRSKTAAIVFKEGKRTDDMKKMEVHGKQQEERKKGKSIAEPIKINPTAQTTPVKTQPTTRKASHINKGDRKDGRPVKLASFNSTSSAKGGRSSTEKQIKKPIVSAKVSL